MYSHDHIHLFDSLQTGDSAKTRPSAVLIT